ncbi:flagellar export chaperone FlgN [Halobacillus sp. Marseille-Q1614]|uniref:flagellar export chaperone FlgN n=1 Tax=Halobacillus sp. Marseille-Q1614 TaxID=2709134 RepID=UPI00352FF0E6
MVKVIFESLDHSKQLHESLLTVSKKKTEALKENQIERLLECLVQERKHVAAIEKLEECN